MMNMVGCKVGLDGFSLSRYLSLLHASCTSLSLTDSLMSLLSLSTLPLFQDDQVRLWVRIGALNLLCSQPYSLTASLSLSPVITMVMITKPYICYRSGCASDETMEALGDLSVLSLGISLLTHTWLCIRYICMCVGVYIPVVRMLMCIWVYLSALSPYDLSLPWLSLGFYT